MRRWRISSHISSVAIRHARKPRADLPERVPALEIGGAKRLEEVRQEVDARIVDEINTAKEDFRALRISGTVALFVGLVLTTLANFV